MKIALLIIYNHRYDKNIPRLEEIYRNRFSHVFHVIPFYEGEVSNVIPVYESSFRFQGYICQAYTYLKDKGFTHFFVVADDMIIHPSLDESNLLEKMGLADDECYIDYLLKLQELKTPWRQTEAMEYVVKQKGVEVSNILPSVEYARERFAKYGIPCTPIPFKPLIDRRLNFMLKYFKNFKRRNLDYPLVGGYVDIILLPAEIMDKFVLYCGAFAATRLFVEFAIPTALVLCSDKLKCTSDLPHWKSGAMWHSEPKELAESYGYNLQKLMDSYPQDKLFLHPIKLSQWK